MSWRGTDGRFMTPVQFKTHLNSLIFKEFVPIGIVWHNTAAPTLTQWGKYTRAHWMNSLTSYYQKQGWSAGPHLFIDDKSDGIGLFTPLNKRGTHSPSFNAQYIGIEHIGDYSKEDDDSGPGYGVKRNGIIATAILCTRLGIDPTRMIKLHKDDPKTDHDCPGKDMAQDKAKSIQEVIEYMQEGGDHPPNWADAVLKDQPVTLKKGIVTVDDLNVRSSSSASSSVINVLDKGEEVAISGEMMNGNTKWYSVKNGQQIGWVAARYINLQ